MRFWPVAPVHGTGIIGYRMTALNQRPEFVFDESLIHPFDPKANFNLFKTRVLLLWENGAGYF